MTYVASNNGITYLATAVTTTPAPGTVETWHVGSTGGHFPQITAGQQFIITTGPPTDLDPEICLVTGLVDGTHWQLQRGAEGSTIKTHQVNDPIMATTSSAMLAALIAQGAFTPTRSSATHTTGSLVANGQEQSTINLAKSYRLLSITTSVAARVRLYDRLAKQPLDANRSIGTIPTGDHGLDYEFVGSASLLSSDVSPEAIGGSMESPAGIVIPITVDNLSSTTQAITVTFAYIAME